MKHGTPDLTLKANAVGLKNQGHPGTGKSLDSSEHASQGSEPLKRR